MNTNVNNQHSQFSNQMNKSSGIPSNQSQQNTANPNQINIDDFLGSGNKNAFANKSSDTSTSSNGGGGCSAKAQAGQGVDTNSAEAKTEEDGGSAGGCSGGSCGGSQGKSNKNGLGGSPSTGGSAPSAKSVDGSKAKIGDGANGAKTIDVDNDGKADVSITGPNAEKLADTLAKGAKENPKLAGLLKDTAEKNPNKVAEISIDDLGSNLGMSMSNEQGKIHVDKDFESTGEKETLDTVVHEIAHNSFNENHGASMDAFITNILGSATPTHD